MMIAETSEEQEEGTRTQTSAFGSELDARMLPKQRGMLVAAGGTQSTKLRRKHPQRVFRSKRIKLDQGCLKMVTPQ